VSAFEDRLMRYFDGELDAEETLEVERLLEDSPEAQAWLRDFERIGIVVRAIADDQGARADGIADRVMARLPQAVSAAGSASGAPSAVSGSTGGSAEVPGGRVIPLSRAVRAAPVVALALAAAAAVALLVRSHPPVQVAPPTESVAAPVAVAMPSPQPAAIPSDEPSAEADEPETGASIESVDFGAQNGTIFMVASGPQVTPVVWLVDDSTRTGGRMKPL